MGYPVTTPDKPAWERLCPELPPGSYMHAGEPWWGGLKVRGPLHAWELFTSGTRITRRAYAELIAPGLVREAAEGFIVRTEWSMHFVMVGIYTHTGEAIFECTDAHTLCEAAWTAIEAMRRHDASRLAHAQLSGDWSMSGEPGESGAPDTKGDE